MANPPQKPFVTDPPLTSGGAVRSIVIQTDPATSVSGSFTMPGNAKLVGVVLMFDQSSVDVELSLDPAGQFGTTNPNRQSIILRGLGNFSGSGNIVLDVMIPMRTGQVIYLHKSGAGSAACTLQFA